MNLSRIGLAAATAVVLLAGCNRAADSGNATAANGSAAANTVEPGSRTVAASLAGDGDLGTLNAVAGNAGLADLLGGAGPYTVFAPDNGAFNALGAQADALKG